METMEKNKIELSDYCISFNRRSQRNELNVQGIWLNAVKKQNWVNFQDLKGMKDPENKLYFVS